MQPRMRFYVWLIRSLYSGLIKALKQWYYNGKLAYRIELRLQEVAKCQASEEIERWRDVV